MKFEDDDQEAAYVKGFADGEESILRKLRKELDRFGREKERWTDLLTDPEKLVGLAENDPEFSAAMTTAVVALLMAEDAKEKAWEATAKPDE